MERLRDGCAAGLSFLTAVYRCILYFYVVTNNFNIHVQLSVDAIIVCVFNVLPFQNLCRHIAAIIVPLLVSIVTRYSPRPQRCETRGRCRHPWKIWIHISTANVTLETSAQAEAARLGRMRITAEGGNIFLCMECVAGDYYMANLILFAPSRQDYEYGSTDCTMRITPG